ncbi:hypothetical protein P0Y35_04535 [Kiritimatiellaeota bacterium B1221]|nr:hypothetical protein [Kiritimatiellaeota bacterium B1221]
MIEDWIGGINAQALASRWVASGLWIAQRGFRRVRGYRDLPLLAEKLNARHAACQEET